MAQAIHLCLIFVAGAVAVMQDLRLRKVKNWLTFSVLALFIILLATGVLSFSPWPFKIFITNIIIGVVASIAMWHFEIWPAGDAKLFILFLVLIPLDYYTNGFVQYFPAMALLINIFFMGVIFLVLKMVVRLSVHIFTLMKTHTLAAGTKTLVTNSIKGIPSFFVTLSFIMLTFLLARMIGEYLLVIGYPLLKHFMTFQVLFLFFFYRQLVTFLRSKFVMKTCFFILFGLMAAKLAFFKFDFRMLGIYMFQIFSMSLVSIVGVQILISVFDVYIKMTQLFKITPDKLEPWVIIDRESVAEALKKHGIKMKFGADGLEPHDLETLQKILPADHEINVHKTFPFAPFIFGGVIATMVIKKSFLHIIMLHFK